MSTPKERPILFSGDMVLAILNGRKTQTRRIGKIQSPDYTELGCSSIGHQTKGHVIQATYRAFPNGGSARWAICEFPYGMPGDRLWVRETWGTNPCYDYLKPSELTRNSFPKSDESNGFHATADKDCFVKRWRPSIFLPRWASRLTLEITKVRVERLNDISGEDAQAEGWPREQELYPNVNTNSKAQDWYMRLWDSINGKGSWEKNPWVWIIEFSRIKP